nr:hypothetical protein LTR18_007167 [Exophiala xenobiotica]
MSDLLQEMADVPKDFFKDGTQFINRCTKRTLSPVLQSPFCPLRSTVFSKNTRRLPPALGAKKVKTRKNIKTRNAPGLRDATALRKHIFSKIALETCLDRFCALRVISDRREFIKISQAVGMGFLIMGAIGYFIKLSTATFRRDQQSEKTNET